MVTVHKAKLRLKVNFTIIDGIWTTHLLFQQLDVFAMSHIE